MSIVEELRKAKALIDTPERWVKGAGGGIDANGNHTYDKYAMTARTLNHVVQCEMSWAAANYLYDCGATELSMGAFGSDEVTTHADIMALFDRAIAAAMLAARKESTP